MSATGGIVLGILGVVVIGAMLLCFAYLAFFASRWR